jgi:hypothetical protein
LVNEPELIVPLTSDNGNTHTATTKNTTQISYLKNLVDIDGKDSDVDYVLVKSVCIVKHIRHSTHLTNIPTANILIKGVCVINKHSDGYF